MCTCCDAFDKHWIIFSSMWHLPRLSHGRNQGDQNVHIAVNNLVTYELQLDIFYATELYVTYIQWFIQLKNIKVNRIYERIFWQHLCRYFGKQSPFVIIICWLSCRRKIDACRGLPNINLAYGKMLLLHIFSPQLSCRWHTFRWR